MTFHQEFRLVSGISTLSSVERARQLQGPGFKWLECRCGHKFATIESMANDRWSRTALLFACSALIKSTTLSTWTLLHELVCLHCATLRRGLRHPEIVFAH